MSPFTRGPGKGESGASKQDNKYDKKKARPDQSKALFHNLFVVDPDSLGYENMERYIRYIGEGDTVRVVIGASRREPFSGTISAILPEGNPDSRTFPVRIDIPNPDFTLKSGMEAIAAFNLGKKRKMILVPKDAIVTADGKRLVFVVNDGIVRQVNIKTTGAYGTRMAVRGSLKAGDSLVVRGNERLEPGQPVLVLPLPTSDS